MDVISWILLLVTVAVFWKYLSVRNQVNAKLPPGTMGLPVIGETISFMKNRNKWAEIKRQKYGPIYKASIFGMSIILINDPVIAWDLLYQENKIVVIKNPPTASGIFGPFSLSNLHGTEHTRQRKWLSRVFYRSALDTYIPTLQQLIDRTIEKWIEYDAPIANMTNEIQKLVSNSSARVVAGIEEEKKCRRLESLITLIAENLVTPPINLPGFMYRKVLKAKDEIKVIMRDRFDTRDPNATGTVLDCLRKNQQLREPPATIERMCESLVELFIASNATLKSSTSLLILYICKYPAMKKRILDEISAMEADTKLTSVSIRKFPFTNAFLKETLRITPPVGGIFRKLLHPLATEKYVIPAGWTLLLSVRSIHANAQSVTNPEEFNPERWLEDSKDNIKKQEYIPFGGGQRQCIGKGFAETFMLLFIMKLVKCNLTEVSGTDELRYLPLPLPAEKFTVKFEKESS